VKLPPAALTAPSLCPRCDAPAMYLDRCGSCELPLRQCAACQGVAGPFDRFCGFCGHDLSTGEARSGAWRLWLVVAMIPLLAGIGFGISPLSQPLATKVAAVISRPAQPQPSPTASPGKNWRSQNLRVQYTLPKDWSGFDYSLDKSNPQKLVVVARMQSEATPVAQASGDLLSVKPSGAVMTLGPTIASDKGDQAEPGILLAFQLGQLVAQPPAGTKVEISRQAQSIVVDGHPAAEAVVKITRQGSVWYLERVYISGPGSPPLFEVQALVPQADWESGDSARAESVIQSIRLT